jgi:hypothetical protein
MRINNPALFAESDFQRVRIDCVSCVLYGDKFVRFAVVPLFAPPADISPGHSSETISNY